MKAFQGPCTGPGEMFVCNRIREVFVGMLPVLEDIVHNLVVGRSVQEIHPSDSLVAISEFRSIHKRISWESSFSNA